MHIRSGTQWSKKKKGKDEPLITPMLDLVEKYPAIGFWQDHFRIRRMGYLLNHKRVYKVFSALRLNIVDDSNREVLHIEEETSLPTARLIRYLEMLNMTRGYPSMIGTDNGPELVSAALDT